MASTISAGTTTTTALVQTADTSGVLQLQTNGGTTALTLDTSQNVGIGVTPSAWGAGVKTGTLNLQGGNFLASETSNQFDILQNAYLGASNWTYVNTAAASFYQQSGGQHKWFNAPSGTAGTTVSWTQAMTLDVSGNLLLGTTSNPGVGKIGIQFSQSTNQAIALQNTSASNSGNYINFYNSSGTLQGYIGQTNSTTTAYVTSSDYRLKENVQPMTGALAKVVQLNPCTYTWKDNGFEGEGFIAHELAEVCHHAVVGEKDAVDANGNPVYQGIDTSFLVATLTAAIQELSAQVTSLKATVETQATTIATLQNKIGA